MDANRLVEEIASLSARTAKISEMFNTSICLFILAKDKKKKVDHRTLPRSERRTFFHDVALYCMERDFFGSDRSVAEGLYAREFHRYFRISLGRLEVLMQDMASYGGFFKVTKGDGIVRPSLEARLLLPLKTLAYGVPSHVFTDYFQMSAEYARTCCKCFDVAIKAIYTKEFLRLPTETDIKNICTLHRNVHGIDGLLGSLDCTHTWWKNCPKAWQGQYKGKEKKPSIVLEAVADYHLFFWHLSYGYCGTLNDLNILALSPLMDRLIDGSFHDLEKASGVVPFTINDEEFNHLFMLVDGIYPPYSRFARGIKMPITKEEKVYTGWQEACRKDVERAFGVVKQTWQFLDRPILLHHLGDIANRVSCCLLLHNMIVTDRVMAGPDYDFRQSYNPCHAFVVDDGDVEQPIDLIRVQRPRTGEVRMAIGVDQDNNSMVNLVTNSDRFRELKDPQESNRLCQALIKHTCQKVN